MANANDMRWFKQTFKDRIEPVLQGTPFTLDMLTALACQETGEVWPILRTKDLSVERILELCVGDTYDATSKDPRTVFPTTRDELVHEPNGQQMFEIARQALVDMAQYIPGYQSTLSNPDKFCHGFGIFQYDIQFFKDEPDYFLSKRYADFDACLAKCMEELRSAAHGIGFGNKAFLTDTEMAYVAIAYNTGPGNFNLARGLRQGHKDGHTYYGQQFHQYLELAKTVQVDGEVHLPTESTGSRYEVTSNDPLRLRSEAAPDAGVQTKLPHGHIVRAVTNQVVNGFLEVETDFEGKHWKGYASAQYLKAV
jgi:hypothetical protein